MIKLKPILKEDDEQMQLERAKEADLITLPENVEGTNCGNCKFFSGHGNNFGTGMCIHPRVSQKVTARDCCALWDAPGTKRKWEEKID
jgi:hypothetical protein